MIILFLFADAMMTLVPFVITGIYYPSMPDKIPLFVNLMGEPIMMANKTLLTAFRLPVMSLIIQAICLVMYLGCRKNTFVGPKTPVQFRNFWLAASLTAAIKLSLSSLPYTGAVPYYMITLFRELTIAATLLGVLIMIINLVRMLMGEKANIGKAFTPAGRIYVVLLSVLLTAYVVAVFLPKVIS